MRRSCLAVLVLLACSNTSVPPPDATHPDRSTPETPPAPLDTDGDGLCDATEARLRTDPRQADTDGDGLLDGFESQYGSSPLTITDPSPVIRLTLVEAPAALAVMEQFVDYHSDSGDVLQGVALDGDPGVDGRSAVDFGLDVAAVDAMPAAFVRSVSGSRFLGVLGDVLLHWRLTARMPPWALRGCRRAYDLEFVVKREGASIVWGRRLILDVVPPAASDAGTPLDAGATDAGAPWPRVGPEGFCLPEPPCR